ncbi:MAG: hypothetical protein IJZ49_00775 [Alistipes sp.]|nr:hypothetical protein [Alistipes sp.]
MSYFEAARRWENRSILSVCEDFHIKADAEIASFPCLKSYKVSYFGDCRSLRKRSLLDVNEHFEDKQDAEIASLYGF